MSTPVDEFTLTYQKIRSGLLGFPGFAALVKPGNFFDLSDPKGMQAFRSEIGPGDTPEAALVEGKFLLTPFGRNSQISEAQQAYTLIYTLDVGLNRLPLLNGLKKQSLLALRGLGPNLGLPFVRDWNIGEGTDDCFGGSEWKRGSLRWTSALNVNVTIYFAR